MSKSITIESHQLQDKIATTYAVGFYDGMKAPKTKGIKSKDQLLKEINAKGAKYATADLEITSKLDEAMKGL